MAPQQDFCGLEHDLSETVTGGRVRLKPRERLLTEIFFLLRSTLSRDLLPPALCSKMVVIVGFLFPGTCWKVGRGGQHAMRQCMYADVKPYRVSHRLRRAPICFTKVFTIMPERAQSNLLSWCQVMASWAAPRSRAPALFLPTPCPREVSPCLQTAWRADGTLYCPG